MNPIKILSGLGWILLALGAVGGLYALTASVLVRRFMAATAPAAPDGPTGSPAVSLIKPLHGFEPGLAENLESFCRQAYSGPVQILFGVQSPDDPAIPVVEAVKAAHPDLDITLVVDATPHGANHKVANLINIAAHARHPVLVVSDSDIRVPPRYLTQVVGALGQPGVGVVSCLYVGLTGAGVWSTLSAMSISHQFLPNAVLGSSLGLAEPCFGSTIALTAGTLAAVGGFQRFADHLADDYEIGRAVRAMGLRIALPPMVVGHVCAESGLNELMAHEIRWGRTIRLIDGAGYVGSGVTHGLPLALAGALLTGFNKVSVALVLAILVSRLILRWRVDQATGIKTGSAWLVPLRDVLSLAVFLASFAARSVAWRGRRFRVGPDGALTHL